MNKKYFLTSLVLVFAFALSVHAQSWVPPTSNPPLDNAPAPVNVGSFNQSKNGFFTSMNFFGNSRIGAKEIRATSFCLQPLVDFPQNILDWAQGASPLTTSNCIDFLNPWGSGGTSDYTPQGPTSITAGGITAGTNLGITPITFQSLLDRILYPYVGPTISITVTPAPYVREQGSSVAPTITPHVNVGSNPITGVSYFQAPASGGTPSNIFSSGSAVAFTAPAINTPATFYATVNDASSSATSNSVSYSFVYPYYYGADTAGLSALTTLSASQMSGFTKVIQPQGSVSAQSSPAGEVYYFFQPASYPVLQSIRDNNGFETIGDYTVRNGVTITNTYGASTTYRVYEFKYPTTQFNFTNTYQ